MTTLQQFHITGIGKALPPNPMWAEDLDDRLLLPRGSTLKRSGIFLRHFAPESMSQSALGAQALTAALKSGGLKPASIDLVIAASAVPEQVLPNSAGLIAQLAGVPSGTTSFDVNQSCLSFLAALHIGASLLATKAYKRIAIVSVDLPSRGLNWNEAEASYIFGDGAAAVIIEWVDGPKGLLNYTSQTFPEGRQLCNIKAGGSAHTLRTGATAQDFLFDMSGKRVFKDALKALPALISKVTNKGECLPDWVVPHQASHLAMQHAVKHLHINPSRVVDIYSTHGNQVAASMPTALHHLLTTPGAKPDDKILLIGTAAGLTVGAGIVRI